MYASGLLAPQTIDTIASQIDVAPTILALLNMSYVSRFFGQDIMTEGLHHQRALMSNYLTVGYLEDNLVTELLPKRRVRVVKADTGQEVPVNDPRGRNKINETIAYYQIAAMVLRNRK